MEREPDTTNVAYIDEYPELKKRVWLRRLNEQRLSQVVDFPQLLVFPEQQPPDEPA